MRVSFLVLAWSVSLAVSVFAQTNGDRNANVNSSLATLATCSPSWIEALYEQCDGRPSGDCYSMLEQARHLLVTQREIMKTVLVDPEEFVAVEEIWTRYRNAECLALVPQCPEGQSGSCNTPTSICEVLLDCDHIIHLRATECQTGGYNRSLYAPQKPDTCK